VDPPLSLKVVCAKFLLGSHQFVAPPIHNVFFFCKKTDNPLGLRFREYLKEAKT
jgi:hypothetical protein